MDPSSNKQQPPSTRPSKQQIANDLLKAFQNYNPRRTASSTPQPSSTPRQSSSPGNAGHQATSNIEGASNRTQQQPPASTGTINSVLGSKNVESTGPKVLNPSTTKGRKRLRTPFFGDNSSEDDETSDETPITRGRRPRLAAPNTARDVLKKQAEDYITLFHPHSNDNNKNGSSCNGIDENIDALFVENEQSVEIQMSQGQQPPPPVEPESGKQLSASQPGSRNDSIAKQVHGNISIIPAKELAQEVVLPIKQPSKALHLPISSSPAMRAGNSQENIVERLSTETQRVANTLVQKNCALLNDFPADAKSFFSAKLDKITEEAIAMHQQKIDEIKSEYIEKLQKDMSECQRMIDMLQRKPDRDSEQVT